MSVFCCTAILWAQDGLARGSLEFPAQNTTVSGITLFSGWHCDAEIIEISVNGQILKAAYGTSREDTQTACGDSDNGFGLLFNMSLLGDGQHEVVAFADGQEFARSTFDVERLSTGEFMRGAFGEVTLRNFPSDGREIELEWNQAAQNFFITEERESPDPYDVAGVWVNSTFGVIASLNTRRDDDSRVALSAVTTYPDGWQVLVGELVGVDALLQSFEGESPEVQARAVFTSPDRLRITVDRCSPAALCAFTAGTVIGLERAF